MKRDTPSIHQGSFAFPLLVSILVLMGAAPLRGQVTWINPGTGNWSDSANWSPATVPTAVAPQRVIIDNGTAIIDAFAAGTNSVLPTFNESLILGDLGTAAVIIRNGGTLASTNNIMLGYSRNILGAGSGTATVTGIGSKWNASRLFIGYFGPGSLTIEEEGEVVSAEGYLGAAASLFAGEFGEAGLSAGTVTVTGAKSKWTVTDVLVVGGGGVGTLKVEAGGTVVSNASTTVGVYFLAGAQLPSTATVTGLGSTWENGGHLTVAGAIIVEDKGRLTSASASMGRGYTFYNDAVADANVNVTVTGAGSVWENTGLIGVGGSGLANMVVKDGGKVITGSLLMGSGGISDGRLTVTDEGSLLEVTGDITVGGTMGGLLRILNKGVVTSGNAYVGKTEGAPTFFLGGGNVWISGVGAEWNVAGELVIGDDSHGGVVLMDGSKLSVGAGLGLITLARDSSLAQSLNGELNSGVLRIGGSPTTLEPSAPGLVEAAEITSGDGNGRVQFNHDSTEYFFTRDTLATGVPITITGGTGVDAYTGVTTLLGTHTYTGTTELWSFVGQDPSVLYVDGALGSTAVMVNSLAKLGGSGSIAGPVTVGYYGVLAPGNSPGTLTVGELILNYNGILEYELGTPDDPYNPDNDLLIVNGNVSLLGGILKVIEGTTFGAGTYRLIDYTGTLADFPSLTATSLNPDYGFEVDVATAGQVNLIVSAVFGYWDGPNTMANAVEGGTGTWNNTTTNWTNSGGTPNGAWSGKTAAFTGTPGTVTLGDDIAFQGLAFQKTGYVIAPDAGEAYKLLANGPFTIRTGDTVAGDTALFTATIHAVLADGSRGGGPGALVKEGPGTLVLTAENTYTGGTTINDGVLKLGDGGAGGSVAGNIINNATLIFHRSDDYTQTGIISGPGDVKQQGPGALTLEGTQIYTGETQVLGGKLILPVSASIAGNAVVFTSAQMDLYGRLAGNVHVSGGTLTGNGIIGGNLLNEGVVAPGPPPATLTVEGSYTQTAAGSLVINIHGWSPGQYDRLAVTGSATLAGRLVLNAGPGLTYAVGNRAEIITAGGGVNGQFQRVDSNLSTGTILEVRVVYEAEVVAVEIVQGSFEAFAGRIAPGLTPQLARNFSSLGRSLDGIAPAQPVLVQYLNQVLLENLPEAFFRISPEELSVIHELGVAAADLQASHFSRRAAEIRRGVRGSTFDSPHSMQAGARSASRERSDALVESHAARVEPTAPPVDHGWNVYFYNNAQFLDLESGARAPGYGARTLGMTFGADCAVTEHATLGMLISTASSDADWHDSGKLEATSGQFGLYATLQDRGSYLDALAAAAYNDYDTRRAGLGGRAHGNTNGVTFDALLEGGHEFTLGALRIGPVARVHYTSVGYEQFQERGSLAPLQIQSHTSESLRASLGLEGSVLLQTPVGLVIPQWHVAWQHEFGDQIQTTKSRFASGLGDLFTAEGPETGRDSILLGLAVSVLWTPRFTTTVAYDAQLARDSYSAHQVSLTLAWAF